MSNKEYWCAALVSIGVFTISYNTASALKIARMDIDQLQELVAQQTQTGEY